MSLDPSIDLGVEVLDEGPDDAETVVISWLRPMLPDGQVADTRLPGDPLPFVWVHHIDGVQSIEESHADEVVSVHCLYRKGFGNAERKFASQFMDRVHRRMLLLGRHLEPVDVGGRAADIESVTVFSSPQWADYADEGILHKVGRYRISLSYAKLS